MNSSDGIPRREFLKAGVAAAGLGLGLGTSAAQDPAKSKEAVDLLLEKYRRHQRTGLYTGTSGGGNHIPMTLIAAHRMGASADQINRYGARFKLHADAKPMEDSGKRKPTRETWKDDLGRAGYFQFVDCFDDWSKEASIDAVLKATLPELAKGLGGAFSHDLLRLAYGIDYGSREEIVFALAGWASGWRPSPGAGDRGPAVEPDALLSEILKNTADLKIEPNGGRMGPIAFRMDQVYSSAAFLKALKPVRTPDADPTAKVSELIMEWFTQTHDFTLLHAFTTCQALRRVLPYAGDPREAVSAFWHSACVMYLTVMKVRPDVGKDGVKGGPRDWKEIFEKAPAADMTWLSPYEHTIKLAYSCWLESKHFKRDRYLALASREIEEPSRFV